jgi:gliding motility-associated-like protein
MKNILTILALVATCGVANVLGQPLEYANSQSVSGDCPLGCDVANPGNSVDNDPNYITNSTLTISGVNGDFVGQLLIFPKSACPNDTMFIIVQDGFLVGFDSTASLSVESFLGINSNGDEKLISVTQAGSFGGQPRAVIKFKPTAAFDRVLVKINITSVFPGSKELRLYGAYKKTERPVVSGLEALCEMDTAKMVVSSNNPETTHFWFDDPSVGNLVFTGDNLDTALTSTTSFYVQRCNVPNVPQTAKMINITPLPATPDIRDETICQNSTAVLDALSPSGVVFRWYKTTSATVPFFEGTSFTTPVVQQDTAYYIQSVKIIGGGKECLSVLKDTTTVFVTSATPIATAKKDTICSGEMASLIRLTPVGATFRWYNATSTSLLFEGDTFITNTLNADIDYQVEAFLPNCGPSPTRTTVGVTVKPRPIISGVFGNEIICGGDSLSIVATANLPRTKFEWFTQPTFGSLLPSDSNIYNTGPLSSSASVYIHPSLEGCYSLARTDVKIQVNQIPLAPTVTGDTIVCKGSSTVLAASSGTSNSTFEWLDESFIKLSNSVKYNTGIINTSKRYYVSTVKGGCSSDSVPIDVPVVNPLAAPIVSCLTPTTSTVTFEWTPIGGVAGYLVSVSGGAYRTSSNPNSHTVTGLSSGDSVTILVKALDPGPCQEGLVSSEFTCVATECTDVTFNTSQDTTVCKGDQAKVWVKKVNSNNYSVSFDNGASYQADSFAFFTPEMDTSIVIKIRDDNQPGCPVSAFQKVDIFTRPTQVTQFGSSATSVRIPNGKVQFFDNTLGAVSWSWDFGDGGTSNESNPIYIYQSSDFFSVTLITTNTFGCIDTLSKGDLILAQERPDLSIPNAFTPNNDGKNDFFEISGFRILEYELKIFNEFGKLLYSTTEISEDWDGKSDDLDQPVGVYYYVITATADNFAPFSRKGIVNLVR